MVPHCLASDDDLPRAKFLNEGYKSIGSMLPLLFGGTALPTFAYRTLYEWRKGVLIPCLFSFEGGRLFSSAERTTHGGVISAFAKTIDPPVEKVFRWM